MRNRKGITRIAAMAAAALVLTAAADLKDASAYFTTYVSAGGSKTIHLGSETEIHEDVSNMTKHVSVQNTSPANDCFVRVKVFAGSWLNITYTDKSESGSLWKHSDEDGYWYYQEILAPGASTEVLDVKIGDLPTDFDRDSFNVIVVQECTPVVYDENGTPSANWDTVYTDYQEFETQGEGDDGQ